MSLNRKKELSEIAKIICRDLRRNSTEAEKIFWEEVRNKKFCNKKFYRQYPLFHDITGKETFFVADFYCNEEKLIIEIDGNYHKYKLKEDNERTKILNSLGVRLIRFKNDRVINNIDEVLAKVKNFFFYS